MFLLVANKFMNFGSSESEIFTLFILELILIMKQENLKILKEYKEFFVLF